ncbi:Hypothetical predicted protein [Mytilus galloprovincialis]|uniref:Uncharacterized protein n=1 Tax=Mytilus galloprovincialis TaxID=29158 RepID=A0A8B6HIU9_MYTGA|nr:Hypothetical predicted protein [Mytilus galloprovincialis]
MFNLCKFIDAELNQETAQELIDEARPDLIEDIGLNLRLPPRIVKRGRPKGAEVTVIGLPKKRYHQESYPFLKEHLRKTRKASNAEEINQNNDDVDFGLFGLPV